MASSENERPQDDSADRRRAASNRRIEPPRKAPQTERGLTHSPYFNGPLYQRMSEDLHLGDIDSKRMMVHIHRGKGAKDRYAKRREAEGFFLQSPASSLRSLPALRQRTSDDWDDKRRRPHHLPRAARSRDQISGQRIMNTHRHPA